MLTILPMKRLVLAILIILAVFFPLLGTDAHATHNTKKVWKVSKVPVLDYTNDTIAPHVQAAVAKIGPATKGKVTYAYQRIGSKPCSSVKIKKGSVIVCSDSTKVSEHIAVTQILKKKNTITGGKVWYFGDGDETQLDWALVHELGHTLGLNHADNGLTSIMHPYASDKKEFLSHDLEALSLMYGPKPVKKKSSQKKK
jgi:hypothetical protein